MTNTIALTLAVLIGGFFLADAYYLHWDSHIILMRGLVDIINSLAFWR